MADQPYAKIRYVDEDGEVKEETLAGEDANYGFNEPHQPPFAKIYRGSYTIIVPMARVLDIQSVSARKK